MNDRFLSIGKLAKRSGTSVRMLRHFEGLGLLSPRRFGKRRAYVQDDRNHVAVIKVYQSLGFSLKKVRELRAALSSSAFASAVAMVDATLANAELQLVKLEKQKFFLTRLRDKLAASRRPHESRCFLCGVQGDEERGWWGASLDLFCEPCIGDFQARINDVADSGLRCTACGNVGKAPSMQGVDGAICHDCVKYYAGCIKTTKCG